MTRALSLATLLLTGCLRPVSDARVDAGGDAGVLDASVDSFCDTVAFGPIEGSLGCARQHFTHDGGDTVIALEAQSERGHLQATLVAPRGGDFDGPIEAPATLLRLSGQVVAPDGGVFTLDVWSQVMPRVDVGGGDVVVTVDDAGLHGALDLSFSDNLEVDLVVP